MAKRGAATQLTSDNFEIEEEGSEQEEIKEFTRASEDELKRREIKRAKRSLQSTEEKKSSSNPFSQLKLSNIAALPPPLPNAFVKLVPSTTPQPIVPRNPLHKLTPPTKASDTNKESSKYLNKLKDLNVSVSEWISQHVKKNPHIDLTPVFEDYKRYLGDLEKDDGKENIDESSMSEGEEDKEEMIQDIGEGSKDADIVLPKVSNDTKDDDALLNMRCKLFYKKEVEFVELGLGNIRITKGENGGVNLLFRNDTSMKKILLNVHLSQGVPLSLQKNKVLLVCNPNPPLDVKSDSAAGESSDQSVAVVKPVTYLIKVKDEYSAKNLHSIISSNL